MAWSPPAQGQSSTPSAYTWTTFAGSGGVGSADGVGGAAQFNGPEGMAIDSAGNLYAADFGNNNIRKITPQGVVTTIAGLANNPGSADGIGSNARFNQPTYVAVDANGNVYVSDARNNTIRKITLAGTNWVVSTIAGSAGAGPGNMDGTNGAARFNTPRGEAIDALGNVYVADNANQTIRKLTPVGTNWVVTTIAGNPGSPPIFEGGSTDGLGTNAQFTRPTGITIDGAGNLYVSDAVNDEIRKITPVGTNWMVTTLAGMPRADGSANGTNRAARFSDPAGIAVDASGNLYVGDSQNSEVRKLTPSGTNWVVTTLAGMAGNFGGANGTGTNAQFGQPTGVAVDSAGNVYVSDATFSTIKKITSAGVVNTLAGTLFTGYGHSDGTGGSAQFYYPYGIATDTNGNGFVVDTYNQTIREITPSGVVTTVAGAVTNSGSADGVGNNAKFNQPRGITVAGNGNIYVADTGNNTIRKVTAAGVVSTLAGLAGTSGGGDGTNGVARFNYPVGIAVSSAGNIFVADTGNSTIRKLTPVGTNWVVTTIAGLAGNNGSVDGTNAAARFAGAQGVAVDGAGNVYVADTGNSRLRKLTPVGTNWVVTTIAGANYGFADGMGTNALFQAPDGIALDGAGNIFVADTGNSTIRKATPTGSNWLVTSIGGTTNSSSSQDGAGSAATFYMPPGITVAPDGTVYVVDGDILIRKGVFTAYAPASEVAYSAPTMTGTLTVTLPPPEANGGWRLPWEQIWHNSGDAVSNLAQDNYTIEFRKVPGYLTLQTNFTVGVTNAGITSVTNQYFPTLDDSAPTTTGSLTVDIGPSSLAGTGWRFLGEAGWRAPGSTATNLLPDVYFIEFEPVSGRTKPSSQAVQVFATAPTIISANYLLSAAAPPQVLLPFPVPVNNIGDVTNYPFGFDGQLQSDVGFGSGVAVQTNVVLTAAHIVFNDQTLAYVSQTYWYFRREAGVYEPEPQAARGWYVLSGYAAQRSNDLASGFYGPDQSTPQSRNLDVAALYFLAPMAGGGYGGYLPSDDSPNQWLTGSGLKMLAGYPVDGSLFGDASIVPGVLYQTTPQPYPLSLATDPVANQRVYLAPWFLSYPGNSGGPVYAQFNGYYYPAGIYLGTLFNGSQPYASLVLGIDSQIVGLITNAALLGDNGTNYTGGGVITVVPNANVSAANPGYMQWHLAPPSVVAAGAGWRLQGDASYSSASNYTRSVTSTNAVTVQFKPIPGWILPGNQSVSVLPGQISVYNAFYTVSNPVMVARSAGIGITGAMGATYRIDRKTSLTDATWTPVSTNLIVSNGFNLVVTNSITNGTKLFYRAVWLP